MTRFLVLGPIEARVGSRPVNVGGGRQRALLALLLVHPGEVVSRDRLVEELWNGEPHSLDVYLSRLRRAFREAGAGGVVATRPPGYALDAPDIDAQRFEALAAQGRAALTAGDPAQATELLAEAVGLWRGAAYAEVADEPWARAEAGRLEELRLAAIEDRIDADLALGRHAVLVAELESLASRHPTRERLTAQLMLALYRSGRQADALAAYRGARRTLVDELGLEPGAPLRELEAAILTQDTALDLPRPPRRDDRSAPPPHARARHRPRPAVVAALAVLAVSLTALAVLVGHDDGGARGFVPADGAGAVDPASGRVAVSVEVGSAPAGIASGSGRVWVANGADGTVTRIDPAAGHVDQTIAVGSDPGGIASGAGSIWVTNAHDGTVSRLDPHTGQVVQTITVGRRPVAAAVGDGTVWVADADDQAVVPLDARTGTPRPRVRLDADPRGVAIGSGALWVTEPLARKLVRLDPGTGATQAEIDVGGGAGPVAAGAGAVWVVNTLDGTVSRIDPARNVVTATATVGNAPTGIAAGRGGVWVSDEGGGELVSVDARTGAVRRRYRVGAAPAGVALVGDIPWIAAGAPQDRRHRGGTLLVRYSEFSFLDPAMPHDVHPAIWRATGDGLVALVEAGGAAQLVPDLTTVVPRPTDGGRRYAFRLRRGLRYSTGQTVRASDVRRALERLFVLDSDTAGLFGALRGARACARRPQRCDLSPGVRADDATGTVTLRLTQPDPELLYKLTSPSARPVPPGTPLSRIAAAPVPSTGPYRVARFEPNRRLVLVRNERFREWSRATRPDGYPDRIDIVMATDPDARADAVLRGEADVALEVSTARAAGLRTRHASQVRRHAQPQTGFLSFNVRRPPFDDVRARRAVNLALDRAAVARRLGGPGLSAPTCQILPPHFPGYEPYCPWSGGHPDGRWHRPDLRRARRLVRSSGTRGATVRFLTHRDETTGPAAARALAQALRAIGYRPKVIIVRSRDEFFRRLGFNRWEISAGDWIADFPSPGEFFPLLTCGSPTNGGGFCNARLDRLVTRAQRLQATEPAAAHAVWARADRLAVDQAAWAPVVTNASVEVLSPRTGHFTLDASSLPQIDRLWVR